METSIKIKEETKKKLNIMKYKHDMKSIDDVIQFLISTCKQIIPASELKKEKTKWTVK